MKENSCFDYEYGNEDESEIIVTKVPRISLPMKNRKTNENSIITNDDKE